MTTNIDFRGRNVDVYVVWTANQPDDVRFVIDAAGGTGNKEEYIIANSKPFGDSTIKSIEVPYYKNIYDSLGDKLAMVPQPTLVNTEFYDLFAQMELTGKQFDLQRRPELNAILQVVCKDERAIAFDPTANYEPIQPIIYDVAVNDLELTVTNISIDGDKTPEYSLDGVTYQDSNVLTAVEYGEQTVYVRYKTELYDFKSDVNLVDPNA